MFITCDGFTEKISSYLIDYQAFVRGFLSLKISLTFLNNLRNAIIEFFVVFLKKKFILKKIP